ncbi:MAG: GntR family transcriptional regulator [Rhizobiales bacterium]|nr:GntR family transcriptional regulator [Hyphomicrobiales bacterium]MBA70824.1 GntR family transcriptional regulator [Hyphomicrobiales bacterium]
MDTKNSDLRAQAATGGRSVSLSDRVQAMLRAMIESGRVRNGERLVESQVAKAFGVSRSPARQALTDLLADGLLRETPGAGYEVIGDGPVAEAGQAAKLGKLNIQSPRQWERMYEELERDVATAILFYTVQINERKLAESFGVSRTVTRDTLARMDGVGLVHKDKSGHWIARRITPERVEHLYELRWLLEPQALIQAAPHIPKQELERARQNIWNALGRLPIQSHDFDEAETDLHSSLLSYCPNKEILTALDRTQALFVPTRYLTEPFLEIPMELIEAALKEHEGIVQALLDGDPPLASRMLVSHLKLALKRWLHRFEITSEVGGIKLPEYLNING